MQLWPLLPLGILALSEAAPHLPSRSTARVAQLATDFGMKVFREVGRASENQNVAFSPYGVASVLAMLQLAAAGDTRSQIEGAMEYGLKEQGLPRALQRLQGVLADPRRKDVVQMAGALFVQRDLQLLPAFMPHFYQVFHQRVKQVDFREGPRAHRIINAWVEAHTKGMIQDFLPEGSLEATTRLVLADAVYFQGLWCLPFPEASTHPRLFHKLDGSTISVPMMEQMTQFSYGEFSTPEDMPYDVIELPYQGERLSMLIATPLQPEASPSALLAALDSRLVAEWKSNMSVVTRALVLPRFSLESEVDLRRPLEALGMTDLFNPYKANFSSLSVQESIYVAQALQKVKIDVNESGTEASSATAAVVYSRMAPLEMVLDRPFLFVVRDNPTGTVLFAGHVLEP